MSMPYPLPKNIVDVLESNKEVVDSFVLDKSSYNKHRMHSMLSQSGIKSSRDRERYIKLVAESRRWGRV